MKNAHVAKASVFIGVPAEKAWKALVDPALVKRYLFGTDMKAEWKVGGKITYSGEWEGRKYQDKGVILELDEGKVFKSSYWSAMSGLPDLPENYNGVTYRLSEAKGGTIVSVEQDNVASAEAAEHSSSNWKAALGSMKAILEAEA